MSGSPLADLKAERAHVDGVRVERAAWRDPMDTIVQIARFVVEAADDKDIRGHAGDALIKAGIDGRSGHTIAHHFQALLDDVRACTVYAADPVKKEFIVSPAGMLCLRPGLCIRVGDCDDLTSLLGALCESLGMAVWIVLQSRGPGKQGHVLVAVKDENGVMLYGDPQTKYRRVGERNPGVVSETFYDPHEVTMKATGKVRGPEMVTLGALGAGSDAPTWDVRSRSWFQMRGGALWQHQGGRGGRWAKIVSKPIGLGAAGDRVEPNQGPEQVTKARVAQTQIQAALFELQRSTIDLETTIDGYKKTRLDLGLAEYEAGPDTVKGPADFPRDSLGRVVFARGVEDYARWVLKFAKHLAKLAGGALDGSRQVAFSDAAEIVIQALTSDTLRYVLVGASTGARTIEFTDADGAIQWTMDENGNRSTATPPVGVGALPVIAIVAIVVVAVLALYFIVSKICDTIQTSINEKASTTIAEAVANKQITPEQAKMLLDADAARRAAILKGEADKQKADPFVAVTEAGAGVAKALVIGAGVVGGLYLAKLGVDAWRMKKMGDEKAA